VSESAGLTRGQGTSFQEVRYLVCRYFEFHVCVCVCVCSYFAEAMTQMHARYLADLFNKEVKRKRLQIASIV